MLRIQAIQDPDAPVLRPYRQMRKMMDTHGQGLFVAEGHKVVTRLVESPLKIHSVLLDATWMERLKAPLEARHEQIDAFVTSKETIQALTGFGCFQAIKAVASIPTPSTLEQLCKQGSHPRFLVAMDGLTSADNVGAVVRSAVGFGADGLIVGPTCCPPYLRRAVHTSMGTLFNLPVHHASVLADTLHELSATGFRNIAAHPHADAELVEQVSLKEDICIVMGSEGEGLSASVLQACESSVMIPMAKGTDSLNVASAASVFFYEVVRQRRGNEAGCNPWQSP